MSQSDSQQPSAVTLGYTIFYVADVETAVAFYEQAFGFSRRYIGEDYGELDTGATVLAFVDLELAASNLDEAGGFTPLDGDKPPVGASITLITKDVAATVAAAVEAGATPYTEPKDKPWGQTVAYVRDPHGILVEVATAVAN